MERSDLTGTRMKSEPLPLLMVSNHGDIVGGGELSLLDFLTALDRCRWNPTVVVPTEGEVGDRCRELGIPTSVIPLPGLRYPNPAIVNSIARLHALGRFTGSRLIHANGSRAMFYAGLTGIFLNQPVIWHVRVADRDAVWDRLLARLASRIIVNSLAVHGRFGWLRKPKVHCVYNGVDLSRFYPRPPSQSVRATLGLPGNVPVVMSVGRFVQYKAYDDLLECAALVNQELPAAHWILVGEGECKEALQAQSKRLGLNGRVHFPGWRKDIPDLLALCDLFVMPSHGEHFGRVLVEAMAMGKPVVATSAGGVPEIVIQGETGLLVPAGAPPVMAQAIASLMRDPAMAQRFGEAGRSRAGKHFSLAEHVQGIESIYRKCFGGN